MRLFCITVIPFLHSTCGNGRTEEKQAKTQDESLPSHVRENIRSKDLFLSQVDTNDNIGEWKEKYAPQL